MTKFLWTVLIVQLSQIVGGTKVASANTDSLLWGPYRPNLYFGVRPRIPQNLYFGLMWAKVTDNVFDVSKLRHDCNQADNLESYGWTDYDVRSGGTETIYDPGNGLNLEIQLIKKSGGTQNGNWGSRVKGTFRDEFDSFRPHSNKVSLIWYMSFEKNGSSTMDCQHGAADGIKCRGNGFGLDSFVVEISCDPSLEGREYHFHSTKIPIEDIWKVKGRSLLLINS
jgi:mannosyl-oligosaccharide glucosidase